MLEDRLQELDHDMKSFDAQMLQIKKEKSQPSPGLLQAIATLRQKQENVLASLELWKTMLKVYPNYDR